MGREEERGRERGQTTRGTTDLGKRSVWQAVISSSVAGFLIESLGLHSETWIDCKPVARLISGPLPRTSVPSGFGQPCSTARSLPGLAVWLSHMTVSMSMRNETSDGHARCKRIDSRCRINPSEGRKSCYLPPRRICENVVSSWRHGVYGSAEYQACLVGYQECRDECAYRWVKLQSRGKERAELGSPLYQTVRVQISCRNVPDCQKRSVRIDKLPRKGWALEPFPTGAERRERMQAQPVVSFFF